MGNSAKRSARSVAKTERTARVAELRNAGKTWRQIGEELGIAPATGLRDLEDYRREFPAEPVEALRRTLLERAEENFAFAFTASRQFKTPAKKLKAAATIATILEKHARVGHVIQEAPKVEVVQNSTSNAFDLSKLDPDDLERIVLLGEKARASAKLEDAPPRATPCPECKSADTRREATESDAEGTRHLYKCFACSHEWKAWA